MGLPTSLLHSTVCVPIILDLETFSNSQWVPVKPFDMKQKSHKSLLFATEQLNFTTAPKDNLDGWRDLKRNVSKIQKLCQIDPIFFFQKRKRYPRFVSTRKSVYFTSCCVRSRRRLMYSTQSRFSAKQSQKGTLPGNCKTCPPPHRWGPVKTVPTATRRQEALQILTTTRRAALRDQNLFKPPQNKNQVICQSANVSLKQIVFLCFKMLEGALGMIFGGLGWMSWNFWG